MKFHYVLYGVYDYVCHYVGEFSNIVDAYEHVVNSGSCRSFNYSKKTVELDGYEHGTIYGTFKITNLHEFLENENDIDLYEFVNFPVDKETVVSLYTTQKYIAFGKFNTQLSEKVAQSKNAQN